MNDRYVLRLWDMFDGWIDISGDLTKAEADALWLKKTNHGRKNTCYADGDYYMVFPAGTKMIVTPESLGR